MSSHFSSWNFQAYRMYTVFDGERTGLEQEREREKAPKPLPRATNGKRNKKVHIYRIARIYLGNAVAGCIECQQSPRNAQA